MIKDVCKPYILSFLWGLFFRIISPCEWVSVAPIGRQSVNNFMVSAVRLEVQVAHSCLKRSRILLLFLIKRKRTWSRRPSVFVLFCLSFVNLLWNFRNNLRLVQLIVFFLSKIWNRNLFCRHSTVEKQGEYINNCSATWPTCLSCFFFSQTWWETLIDSSPAALCCCYLTPINCHP